MIRYLLLVFTLFCYSLHAQQEEWVRVFGDNINIVTRGLIETYDGGYMIGGHTKYNAGGIKEGIIIKTDINGEELWHKVIGTELDLGTDGTQIAQTFDGGYILFSGTYKYGVTRNVMLMKLNKCGEKEWNKIFISNDQPQWNVDVLQMPDSNYLILLSYWGNDIANERIWLFKISQDGEIVWQKVYAKWTLGTNAEEGRNLIKNNENEYLITGDYYQYNPGEDTNARYDRPMFIKIDSTGNEMWHLLWGVNTYFYGDAFKSVFNSNGDIYSVGQNESVDPPGYQGAMFKLDKNGNQLFSKNIPDSTKAGISTTISLMQDSILFIGTSWTDWDNDDHTTVYKTDTMGNILKEKELLQESNTFRYSIITHDNKYLVAGNFYIGNNWDIYLWKFNKDLEYDSIYTQPRVYDSLCPHEIVSDTIDLDTTIVNLQELYEQMQRIQVHPNPASTKLFVTLGDLTKGTEFRMFNVNGQVVKHIPVQLYKREYEINISRLPPGLYVVVLFDKGKVADKQKVIIRR